MGKFRGGLKVATDQSGLVAGPKEQPGKNTLAEGAKRSVSLDAYRGFVMLLMMAEVLQLARVAAAYPPSSTWTFLAFN